MDGRKVSTDVSYRKKIFQHYFEKNPGGVRQYRASFDLMVKVDKRGRWNAEKKRNWKTYHPSVSLSSRRYHSVSLSLHMFYDSSLVLVFYPTSWTRDFLIYC